MALWTAVVRYRRVGSWLSWLVTLLVVIGLAGSPGAAGEPGPGVLAATETEELGPCQPAERASMAEALAAAQACGHPVEILDARTETKREWAQPDGTVNAQMHITPEWVADETGGVDRVDLTLEAQPDGSVAPRVDAGGLRLSGGAPGGTAELAVIRSGADEVALGWRGALPEPVLEGTTATYPEVRPGVDLVVEALNSGFEYHLVVKNRQAAQGLGELAVPWRSGALEPVRTTDGGVALRSTDGSVPAVVPQGAMWDASISPQSGEPERRIAVDVELRLGPAGGTDLVVDPDAAFLADPETVYPVTVDPTVNPSLGFDAFVQTGYTGDQSGSSELKLGTYNGGGDKARSFLSFRQQTFYYGAKVNYAFLALLNHWSFSCRHAEWQAWLVSWANSTVRWTNQPTWHELVGRSTQTWGYDACDPDGWVTVDVRKAFQHRADTGSGTTLNIGLKATKESHSDSWKRFRSANASSHRPYVEMNYSPNQAPGTPTVVKPTGDCEPSCASGAKIRVTRPTVQAKASDPNSSHRVWFALEVWNTTKQTKVDSTTISDQPSGSTVTWQLDTTLLNGRTYYYRAKARDKYGAWSAWSGFFQFTIDTSGPEKPTAVGVSEGCHLSCASPAMVRDRTPAFTATPQHPFGDRTDAVFEVFDEAKDMVLATGTAANALPGIGAQWTPTSDLPEDTTIHLRVRSTGDDYGRSGSNSDWYTFTVDTTAPGLPEVTSSLYAPTTWNGGVGQPGLFTFSPGGATDVVVYQWHFGDGDVSEAQVALGASHMVSLAPPGDLQQVLEVQSIDRAGNASGWQVYPFLVQPQAADAGYWKFDESAGTVAPAATEEPAYDGQLHGGASWVASGINPNDPGASGNAIQLDGSSGYVEMPPILATDHPAGFSVSAWVNPDDLSGSQTVVAQNGANTFAFRLYYKPNVDQWCFAMRNADDVAATSTFVCSDLQPQTGVWTHLVGVYDKPAGKLRLYVNGGPVNFQPVPGTVDEIDAPTLWASTGSFQVGRDLHGTYYEGRVDEVRAYQRVVHDLEVRQMFQACLDEVCPPVPDSDDVVMVGGWDLEDAGITATDLSGLNKHGILSGPPGTRWTAFGHHDSRAVVLDGESGWIDTPAPLPLTDDSFTVSAWVRLDSFTGAEQIVAQTDGTEVSALKLYYSHTLDAWTFVVTWHDGVSSTWYNVSAAAPVQLGEWTHLVGVYDEFGGAMRLYVNGQLDGERVGVSAQPAESGMRIGGAPSWGFLSGTIDTVRVYQGAAAGTQVADWYAQQVVPPPVAVEPQLFGDWRLDDGAGLVATDHLFGNNGILSGGATWPGTPDAYAGQYGVVFDGASGQVETLFPLLETDTSFAVSAWVSLADRSARRAAVTMDGQSVTPFGLVYDDGLDRFCLVMHHEDTGGAEPGQVSQACAGQAPDLDEWSHLVGVFDKSTRAVSLYVDGVLAETVSYAGLDPWAATGPVVIGRSLWTPAGGGQTEPADWWHGGIALVQTYQGAMSAPAVADLYDQQQTPAVVAVIDTPTAELDWQVGEEVSFTGHAVDSLGTLPADTLRWQLRLVDCTEDPCQTGIVQEWTGVAGGSFVTPDVGYPGHLELELTADNGAGSVGSTMIELDPATVALTFSSQPAGVELTVGPDPVVAPATVTAIPGATVSVSAPSGQELGGDSYVFDAWSDAGGQAHLITAPATPTEYVASYTTAADLQPTAAIDTPGGGLVWRAGDLIQFSGHATDSQGSLPDTALSWQLWLVSCPEPEACVAEPLEEWPGVAAGSFVGPDADYPAHLELELTADNGSGLTHTALVQLFPATVELTLDGVPSGLQLTVGTETQTAPFTRTVIQSSTVAVGAPTPQDLGGISYVFDGWSDGGTQTHVIEAPVAAATYTASFVEEAPSAPCGSDTFGNTCATGARSFLPATEVLPLTGDDAVTEVSLPFPMWLYGQVYETAWVDTNGVVTFVEPEAPASSVASIPGPYQSGEADAALYPFWYDWLVDQDASVRTELLGTAPNRQYVIEWRDVTTLSDDTVRVSFQVVLHEDGRVAVAWDGIDAVPVEQGTGGVVGIENHLGTDALAFSQFTASLSSGQGVLFTPPAPGAVSGVVTDSDSGVPVFGAPVRLAPGGWTTFTDANGAYEFLNVPVGTHAAVAHRDDGRCAGADAGAVVPVAAAGSVTADLAVGSGMDSFGNTCTEGPQPFLPTTSVLDLDGDTGNTTVPLPFPVWLYGAEYQTAWVDIDGVVTFLDPGTGIADVSQIPSPPAPGRANAAVYPFWNDWTVADGASIRTGTVGTAPDRQFVIEWQDVMANEPPHPRASFQVVFHESGGITVAWGDIQPSLLGYGLDGVVGIENADGTDALAYSQFLPALTAGEGVRFGTKGENLALGAATTADSSCSGSEGPEQAVDGSWTGGTGDRWCSAGAPAWLQVDLGGVADIGNVTLRHAGAGGEDPAHNTRDFVVQASDDGLNWTTVVAVTGNTEDVTSHDLTASGRYLRLDVLEPNSSAQPYTRIYQFEVYAGSAWQPPPPPDPTGNLAWGKPVTADSSCSGFEGPEKAVNGSWTGGDADRWCSNGNPPWGGSTIWLQVDLEAVAAIGNVTIRHAGAGGADPAWNSRDFYVLVSDDGLNWTKIVDVAGNTDDVTSHDVTASGRYLRLDVLTPTSNGDEFARIYELEVYADPIGAPPPPPEPTENLAWGGPVIADSSCSGFEGPEKAVNGAWTGGEADRWCSNGNPPWGGSTIWLQVDLGATTGIGNVTLRHAGAGGDDPLWNTRDFRVQVSDDGLNWITVVEVTGNIDDVTSHDVTNSGRYLRLAVLTPTSNGDEFARIYELEVYADPVGAPPPPPEPTGNLAWGSPVTADSWCSGHEGPEKAVNGSWTAGEFDRWCSNGNPPWGSAIWLQVDLGAVTGIGNITLRHASAGGDDPAWNTRDYLLKVSEDGQTWTMVAEVTGNLQDVTSHDMTASGRYVRLEVLTPTTDGDEYARIYALEVYADPAG